MSEQIPLPRFSVSVSDFVVSIIGLLQSGVSFDIIFLGLGGWSGVSFDIIILSLGSGFSQLQSGFRSKEKDQ